MVVMAPQSAMCGPASRVVAWLMRRRHRSAPNVRCRAMLVVRQCGSDGNMAMAPQSAMWGCAGYVAAFMR